MLTRSLLSLLGCTLLLVGCSSSETTTGPNATTKTSAAPLHPAASVTQTFMQAIVKGDIPAANKLLTTQAVEKLAANKVAFAPEGFQSATFKLGRVEASSPSEAVVQCVVTMQAETGPVQQEVCWCLRQDAGQWRVLGFACDTDAGQPVLWNFETHAQPQVVAPPKPATPPLVNGQATGGPAANVAQQPQTPAANR